MLRIISIAVLIVGGLSALDVIIEFSKGEAETIPPGPLAVLPHSASKTENVEEYNSLMQFQVVRTFLLLSLGYILLQFSLFRCHSHSKEQTRRSAGVNSRG